MDQKNIPMPTPEINIIVAMAANRVIGDNDTIPWQIPEDLHHFKTTTMGHALIMGRKTWESVGRPLPGRTNIILSQNKNYMAEGCHIATTLTDAINHAGQKHDKIFIIGGGQIYTEALPLVHNIYITLLHRNVNGSTFFPAFSEKLFSLRKEEQQQWTEPVTLQHFVRI
jgi:dihydrofolate reductase